MSDFIDAHLFELCIAFVAVCAAIAIAAFVDACRHSHEDEEQAAMKDCERRKR